ncbi:nucleolar protein dao-5 [Drosophila miranda]|uniref:nucleolar protein dao-5 n=1 Tax=Drosophila miranda TaxID=7229 RepID=UPI0007E890E3|nr:nucleolar protein dao-5 [Drosophila miranda]
MSSSLKKKIKGGDQIPKPISIKKEKTEEDRSLHPISHYIDDRLELVKQIFGTLKPKTIMNLAPEFLKTNSLDEIEELCLEELLCLSTKRLKSIIDGTRCPTDTESSEDSDVQRKEEHISLEEISSDSDIGGQEARRTKRKKLKAKQINNGNENKASSGQISVLELLELQARARAIRSQLAMEPITKIEVKSDDDDKEESQPYNSKEKGKEKHYSQSAVPEKRSGNSTAPEKRSSRSNVPEKRKFSEQSARKDPPQTAPERSSKEIAPRQKIKIKRNYRHPTKSPEKTVVAVSSASVAAEDAGKKEQNRSRSASPDVIPIPTETETLLISDSTDDEAPKKKPKETPKLAVEEPPPPPAEESEPEEGEVRDDPVEPVKPIELEKPEEMEKPTEAPQLPMPEKQIAADVEMPNEGISSTSTPPAAAELPMLDDEDQNDDVISIGGDLDMIEEMTKEDEPPAVAVKTENLSNPEEMDNDVILLDTSEDEREKLKEADPESWRTRYLKSSKVSQVLAASRLGKRVRDKIKKTKRAATGKDAVDDAQAKAAQQQPPFASKHEDGSVEQYQELLQHRKRQISTSSKGDK